MSESAKSICVVGAGLAGSECAFQLAKMGYKVQLIEMRGKIQTPAHKTADFAELVCSNSFGSETNYSAPGQLKWEAEQMNSLILKAAREAQVPAGMALGVDRVIFADSITKTLKSHPNIEFVNKAVESLDDLPRPCIVATGPLTHTPLAQSLRDHFGNEFCYFYDAIAPIIDTESINMDTAWKANRYDDENADYINCPLNKEQYYELITAIKAAEKKEAAEFEEAHYFEGCMPIEAIIERGDETLRFGPMSPKGLRNPKTGQREYAIVQLRQENKEATSYNMVGFQTKMSYGAQKEIFRMIPGLEEADFLKLGSIHRNLYIHSPKKLTAQLASRKDESLFFAGQITGVEGYFESTCIGLMVSRFMDQYIKGEEFIAPPRHSAFGSLLNAITEEKEDFQPTNINFSLLPKLEGSEFRGRRAKKERRDTQLQIAKDAFSDWLA